MKIIRNRAKNLLQISILNVVLILINLSTLCAQNQAGKENTGFQAGEKLNYEMSYGWVTGGKASVELKEISYGDKTAFHVKATGYTVGLADKLFYVYDVYESYFDPQTCLPYKSIRNIRENKYTKFQIDTYDHQNNTVSSADKGVIKVKPMTFDVISAAFYLRKEKFENLKPGDILKVHTFFHGDPWDLVIRYKGIETVKLNIGKIECMKFKPVVETGTFEDEDALSIWISNDKNKIPVRVQMNFFVGSFKTDLTTYSGLKNELIIKKK
jgi:hypothetical protein